MTRRLTLSRLCKRQGIKVARLLQLRITMVGRLKQRVLAGPTQFLRLLKGFLACIFKQGGQFAAPVNFFGVADGAQRQTLS